MDCNNCPIREFTADGVPVGRCWYWLRDGLCPLHGDVSKAKQHYIETGELTDDPRRQPAYFSHNISPKSPEKEAQDDEKK